jgi:hypothetical protein
MSSTFEEVLREARKLPPDERRELAVQLLEETEETQGGRPASGAPTERSVWDRIEERATQAPPETWDDAPADGSLNVDHYLYGAPRR